MCVVKRMLVGAQPEKKERSIRSCYMPRFAVCKGEASCSFVRRVAVKVGLTIVDDADHYSVTGDGVLPNRHHIKVKPTEAVLALCKLKRQTHTPLLSKLSDI